MKIAGNKAPVGELYKIDPRSQKNIATIQKEVQPLAIALVREAARIGITIKVISGTRTYAEQDALYAKGRTQPGNIVTRVEGGYSNHNFGIAFDIGIFENGRYVPESPKYKIVGKLGKSIGLEWGGDWEFVDEPHFQLRPDWARKLPNNELVLAALRERVSQNRSLFS